MKLTGNNVRFKTEVTYVLHDEHEVVFKKGDEFFCVTEFMNHNQKVAVIQAPYYMAIVVVADELEIV